MSSKSTCFWALLAAGLLAMILLQGRFGRHPVVTGPARVLPDLKPGSVASIQVRLKGQLEIRAVRTNNTWLLTEPLVYPAQVNSIDNLLTALERLTPAVYISARERKDRPQADEEDGFVPPAASLIIQQGERRTQVWLGAKTPPGDQLFLQVVGVEGVYVVDADLLKVIPGTANDWRDKALLDLKELAFDRITVTNGPRVVEFQRDPVSRLWRIPPILWRADSAKIEDLLQKLQGLRVSQFVLDDVRTDLDGFGLQPPELEVGLGHGSNTVALLQFGKSPTNDASQVYARRLGRNSILTVPKEALAAWYASSVNDFRDPHLLALTAPVQAVEVRGEERFTVQRGGTNAVWRVVPQNFPADAGRVEELLSDLGNLRILEFSKDVVTDPALPAYGLNRPGRTYVLSDSVGRTNAVTVQLDFGTNVDDKVYVRRTDESSVYAIKLADYQRLPSSSLQFRERQVWDVPEDELAGITVRQNGKVRQLVRNGRHDWSLAGGSQGEINPLAVEETARMLGRLKATAWTARGESSRARYGLAEAPYAVALELKSGGKLTVEFAAATPTQPQYAAVTLEGEPWIFEFPSSLFPYVSTYLSLPGNPR